MSKINLSTLLIIFCLTSFSQNLSKEFYANKCEYKTDGSVKSNGLKIQLSVPCKWDKAEGSRPHIVNTYAYYPKTGGSISITLLIRKKTGALLHLKSIGEFSLSELKEIISNPGIEVISTRKTKIDGIVCVEYKFKRIDELTIGKLNSTVLEYDFFYGDQSVVISYSSSCKTKIESQAQYDQYEYLFKSLAMNTILYNQYEDRRGL